MSCLGATIDGGMHARWNELCTTLCGALVLAGAATGSAGCNAINGIDRLAKVDCSGDCDGGSGGALPMPSGIMGMGRYNTCAKAGDEILCWGADLPDGRGGQRTRPTLIPTLRQAERISIGLSHGCAVIASQAYCWGHNEQGQLGDGTYEAHWDPQPVLGPGGVGYLDNVRRLTGGRHHRCAQTLDNDAVCWGANDHGQLGEGTTSPSPVPLLVPTVDKVNKISGGGQFTCAALVDGRVYCWGRNHRGQLGQGAASSTPSLTPLEVAGVSAEKVYGGDEHMCAQTTGGEARCWGAGDFGQLGHGQASDSATPVTVAGLSEVEYLSPGSRHTCAQTGDGVFCWGANDLGQLANDTVGAMSTAPVAPDAAGIDGSQLLEHNSGLEHGCAKNGVDDAIWCWGLNDGGQLGRGTIGGAEPPAPIVP